MICRNALVVATASLALLNGGGAMPVGAQTPVKFRETVTVGVVPRVGLLAPDTYLYEQYANFSGDGPVEWTDGYLRRALILGVGIEVARPGGGAFLRAELARSVGGWMSVSRSIVVERQLFDPPYVRTDWLDVPAALTTGSLQLVLPTRLTLWRAQPYVLAGFQAKRYSFGEPTTANEFGAILPADGVTWGGDIGAGFILPLMGLRLDLQARDAISRYWGKTEHDFLLSAGVILRIRQGRNDAAVEPPAQASR